MNQSLIYKIPPAFFILIFLYILHFFQSVYLKAQSDDIKFETPLQFRMLRIYADNDEKQPPILIIQPELYKTSTPLGGNSITIEFDIDASVPPPLFAQFSHCNINWKEDNNIFLNDITLNRTSDIIWSKAPIHSTFYTFRGFIRVPNNQVQFKYSGNWKVKLYSYDNSETPLIEAKFFVVKPIADCSLDFYNDIYEPDIKVAPASLNIDAYISSSAPIFDSRLNTVIIFRNHRFNEPYIISDKSSVDLNTALFKYNFKRYVGGFTSIAKKFRIERIPVENTYRVLDLTNLAQYPRTSSPSRIPFSDLRRSGSYSLPDDDGAMITSFISNSTDDYVYVEFVMDPDGWISNDDVFISGSFNNWKPDSRWQMFYDKQDRYYKLRQWVRRARHNYMFATGKYNDETKQLEKISFEEFEGNSSATYHTYIALVYYQDIDFGGYDSIIGIGAAKIYGNFKR